MISWHQFEHLKGLIYESEMAAMIYGRQIQRLESLPPTNDVLLAQSRANLKNEYQNKWVKHLKTCMIIFNHWLRKINENSVRTLY